MMKLTCVDTYIPCYNERRKLPMQKRLLASVQYLVWHTTGVGIYKRSGKAFNLLVDGKVKKIPGATLAEAAGYVYQNIMKNCAHFIIALDGTIIQTCDIESKAQHVGTPGKWSRVRAHAPEWWQKYDGFKPVPSDGSSVNSLSFGCEFISPQGNSNLYPEQIEAARVLSTEIAAIQPVTHTTHCLVRPDLYTVNGKLSGGRTVNKTGKPFDLTLNQMKQLRDAGLL